MLIQKSAGTPWSITDEVVRGIWKRDVTCGEAALCAEYAMGGELGEYCADAWMNHGRRLTEEDGQGRDESVGGNNGSQCVAPIPASSVVAQQ